MTPPPILEGESLQLVQPLAVWELRHGRNSVGRMRLLREGEIIVVVRKFQLNRIVLCILLCQIGLVDSYESTIKESTEILR